MPAQICTLGRRWLRSPATPRKSAWLPALSPIKRQAAERGQAGRGAKLCIKVKGRQQRFVALGLEDAPLNFVHVEYIEEDTTTLVCFGPDAAAVDIEDLAVAQRYLDRLVPGLEVLEAAGYNWVDDPYSQSTWPMHYTGYLTESLAELQRPEGLLHLAGSDFANGWGGFIDGAIESGLDAGRRIRDAFAAGELIGRCLWPSRFSFGILWPDPDSSLP